MRTSHLRTARQRPLSQRRVAAQLTLTVDQILSRVANASQAGLLILAVFGYFYTVLPVYQKSLLDEEIAKKTIELQVKETELSQKNLELASVTSAVTQMRGSLNRSQAEVGRLKNNLSEQYSELRYRLLEEFQLLGTQLCRIDKIPEGTFATCLTENVLPTYNLKSLSAPDRDLLTKIAKTTNAEATASWREIARTIKERQEAFQRKKAESASKCEDRRNSDDYKDKRKRIDIDYLCNSDYISVLSESLKVEIDDRYSGDNFTRSRLSEIGRTFIGKTSSK